jgi:hypothetical protein
MAEPFNVERLPGGTHGARIIGSVLSQVKTGLRAKPLFLEGESNCP